MVMLDKPIRLYYTLGVKTVWKDILTDQVNKVIASGLGDAIESWNFGINLLDGTSPDEFHLPVPVDVKPNILYVTTGNPWEVQTYLHMINHAKESIGADYYSLYFHSKGVNQNPNAKGWREYMEYFVIENWKDCIEGLGVDYDTCGPELVQPPPNSSNLHYSGCFWWSTSQYLRSLDLDLFDQYLNTFNKFATEQFSCSNLNARHKSLHNRADGKEFYNAPYPPEQYRTHI
jgi:hypothetical protein